jgi:hypothetical protein
MKRRLVAGRAEDRSSATASGLEHFRSGGYGPRSHPAHSCQQSVNGTGVASIRPSGPRLNGTIWCIGKMPVTFIITSADCAPEEPDDLISPTLSIDPYAGVKRLTLEKSVCRHRHRKHD